MLLLSKVRLWTKKGGCQAIRVVFYVPFSGLTLMVRCQERHPAHKNTIPLILRGSILEQVEEDQGGTEQPRFSSKNGP